MKSIKMNRLLIVAWLLILFVSTVSVALAAWSPVTVDAPGAVSLYTSLAVVNGNPAISYLDITTVDLKFARSSNPTSITLSGFEAQGQSSLPIFWGLLVILMWVVTLFAWRVWYKKS